MCRMSRSVEPNLAFGIDFQSSHFCEAGTVRLVSSEETLSFPFIGSIFTKQVQFSKANMLEWSSQELNHYKMVRISKALLKEAGTGLSKTLSEILVCPLTKQPLRYFFFHLGLKYWYSWFAIIGYFYFFFMPGYVKKLIPWSVIPSAFLFQWVVTLFFFKFNSFFLFWDMFNFRIWMPVLGFL